MRVLLTGAGGQVGRELVRLAPLKDMEIAALDHPMLDITDPIAVRTKLKESRVDFVVNAAAYTSVDEAEKFREKAFAVNRDGPGYLALACKKAGVPLFHLSTDYVFDGQKNEPYRVTDPVAPPGVYGESKAAGEAAIREYLDEHVILRTAWVYGVHGRNFLKTMLRLGQEKESLRVVADQYGSPTYAADLGETILTIVALYAHTIDMKWGTYHFCGKGVTTWHGLAERIFEYAEEYIPLKVKEVRAVGTDAYPTPAKRPLYSVLDCSLIRDCFGIQQRPWQESLQEALERILREGRGF